MVDYNIVLETESEWEQKTPLQANRPEELAADQHSVEFIDWKVGIVDSIYFSTLKLGRCTHSSQPAYV